MGLKPIEHRALWVPSSSMAQGKLECFVEIMSPEEAASTPPVSLAAFLAAEYEVRVIIHKAREIQFRDKVRRVAVCGVCCVVVFVVSVVIAVWDGCLSVCGEYFVFV